MTALYPDTPTFRHPCIHLLSTINCQYIGVPEQRGVSTQWICRNIGVSEGTVGASEYWAVTCIFFYSTQLTQPQGAGADCTICSLIISNRDLHLWHATWQYQQFNKTGKDVYFWKINQISPNFICYNMYCNLRQQNYCIDHTYSLRVPALHCKYSMIGWPSTVRAGRVRIFISIIFLIF